MKFLLRVSVSMSYYGISFSASNLTGDFFLNYELLMQVLVIYLSYSSCTNWILSITNRIVEIPAHVGSIISLEKLGRRFTLSASLLISGLACLATGLLPNGNFNIQTKIYSFLKNKYIYKSQLS